jgi:ABC-type protease/lipase transport system fused ATPase/permease subunit
MANSDPGTGARRERLSDLLSRVLRGTPGLGSLLGWVAAFSAAINLLLLAPAFFVLQVFDRVLVSRSQETLWVLLAAVVAALASAR